MTNQKQSLKLIFLLSLLFIAGLSLFADEMWSEDFKQVLKLSETTNKPILINFTGSDWCGWCVRLHDEVFSKDEFKKFANENLILFKADFPRNIKQSAELIKQNRELQKEYDIKGFPTIVIVDKNQKIIARTGYKQGGVTEYIKHLEELLK